MPSKFLQSFCLAVAFLVPVTALAVQPHDDAHVHEIDRRGSVRNALHPAARSVPVQTGEWSAYLGRNAGWTAEWSPQSGRMVKATGPASTAPGGAFLSEAAAVQRARSFLSAEMAPWVPADAALDYVKSSAHKSGRWVHFGQNVGGVPVFNARVTVRMGNDGRVTQVANHAFPGLDVSTTPAVTPELASTLGAAGLPAGYRATRNPELSVLPLNPESGNDARLTWRVEYTTMDPPGRWITFVDAVTGDLLWRFNAGHFAEVNGTVNADIELVKADNMFNLRGLPYVDVRVTSATDTTVSTCDVLGVYQVTTPDSTGRNARARLAGPFGRVWNVANPQAPTTPSLTFPLSDAASAFQAFKFDNTNSLASERDAYYHSMVSHDYIKTIEPGFNLLDYQMPISVEVAGSCNAFWDGLGINFFVEDNRCTNTARSATVVMHEYGHGITDFLYRPFFPSGAMHEGFSDYYAATITDQPILGAGFRKGGGQDFIRRIDVDRIAPDHITGAVHNDGLVIASALWNIREVLGRDKTDELWHFARYGFADNFDDYVFDVLVTDDDDNNVYNGTPNFTLLANTFRKHGIGDFRVHISHPLTPDTEDTLKAFPITASFLSLFALDPSTVTLHTSISTNGGTPVVTAQTMMPTGGNREYTFTIPNQPAGTVVSYYLTATDTTGTTGIFPAHGDSLPAVFHVGPDAVPPVITHTLIPDQPIDTPPILVLAGMRDNLDKALHAKRLVHRSTSQIEAITDMTALGDDRYRAAIPSGVLSLGDLVEYRFEAIDSAAAPLTTALPDTGWFGFRMVRGFARDFEADNGGLTGGGDWAWGDPTPITTAWSGTNVWATAPTGNYADNSVSTLSLPPVDLSAFTRAALTFRHYMNCEPDFDGGRVDVSTDQGTTWSALVPDGGYNTRILAATGQPGYSGKIDWSTAEFNLSSYVGLPDVRFRLRFAADSGLNGPGWYIDDLQVVERQILVTPLSVRAASGRDGFVPLAWDLPPGVLENATNPVTGYNLYRSLLPDGEPTRVNGSPIAARTYSDSTITNGSMYAYSVSVLFGAVESALTPPVEAFPYRALFSANRTAIGAMIDSVGTATEVLSLSNAGSGPLRTAVYRAAPGQTIDQVRIRLKTGAFAKGHPPDAGNAPAVTGDPAELLALAAARKMPARPVESVAPTGVWDTLFVDTQEGAAPDLVTLQAQQTSDFLYFRFTTAANWGNPFVDFNFLLAIDTDGNPTNGTQGGDFLLMAGPLTLSAFGAPVMLMTATFSPVEFPHHFVLGPSSSVADFGIRKSSLGDPDDIRLNLMTLNPQLSQTLDRMPNTPAATWLSVTPRFLQVGAGASGDISVGFNSAGLADGQYLADLLVESNDPGTAVTRIPVTLDVSGMVPVVLSGFSASPGPDGIELSWTTAEETDHLGFHVWRSETAPFPAEEVRVNADLVTSRDGRYAFTDAGVEPGRTYAYRLGDVSRSGVVTFHGPFAVRVPGEARPDRLWLAPAVPNPTRAASTIRFGLPAAGGVSLRVFNIEGRLVRTIADNLVMPAGFHETAWDGMDDGGAAAAAGIYFYRLDAGGKKETKKLLIVR